MGVPRTESSGRFPGSKFRPPDSAGTPPQSRHSRSARVRAPGGRPTPDVRRGSSVPSAPRAATWRERLDESFPLLFFGGASLVMAVVALLTNTQIGSTRYPLWVLFLGLGSIATLGGTAAVLAEDDDADLLQDALESGEYVAIPREELAKLRRAAGIPDTLPTPTLVPSTTGRNARSVAQSASQAPTPRTSVGAVVAESFQPMGVVSPNAARETPPWEERETDAEDPASSGIPNVRASRPVEDEVETLLAELERNISLRTGVLPRTAPRRAMQNPPSSSDEPTGSKRGDPDFDAALDRIERGLPTALPDPADAWIDRASLPQEFSRLLSEMYPPERAGHAGPSSTSRPVGRVGGGARCSNCSGRLLSSTGECSVCHLALCRTCTGLLSLTSEKPICDRCAHGS